MATTGSTRTSQENLLRTVYERKMVRQHSLRSILLQGFRRNIKNFAPGKEISIALHAAGGEGPTWNRAGQLPPASFEQVERATFNYEWLLDRIEIAGDFEDDAASAQAAEQSPLEFQAQSLVNRVRHDLNFDLFGDGSGKVATPVAGTSATTFTVANVRGLRNNMRIDILLTANGSVGAGGVAGAKITINRATKVVTLTGGQQLADGAGAELTANASLYTVYRGGARNQAIFGLDAVINNVNTPAGVGNYGNIDRSNDANDFYRAVKQANGGVPRSPGMKIMQDVLDEIDQYSEGNTNLIICEHQVWNALAELMDSNRRYRGETTTLNGWATALKFASVKAPIVKDKHCDPTRMYFLDTTKFRIYQNHEGAFMSKDGSMLFRVAGKVAYEASWTRRLQLICWSPIAQGVLTDLAYVSAAA